MNNSTTTSKQLINAAMRVICTEATSSSNPNRRKISKPITAAINDKIESDVIDVVVEKPDTIKTVFAKLTKAWPKLTFKLVSKSGPGGGWPEVEVSGPSKVFKKFMRAYEDGESL